jgi:adenine deaminase
MNCFKIKSNIVDIVAEKIFPGIITISDQKIVKIEKINEKTENFLIPGFIDAHVHIESSMLTPFEFAKTALSHGTIGVVSDPHEIANVLGIDGVLFMIENAQLSHLKFYFSAPSCVPATSFETSGAKIGLKELETLLKRDDIKYLGEFMNFPGVIHNDEHVLKKLALARNYNKLIDGHAPALSGDDLRKYVSAGISTDHECLTSSEALEKISLGMKILIREGSACKDFDNLISIAQTHYKDCMFCCDDLHPDDLMKGHINLIVKKALETGLDIFKVLRMSSLNPIKHYNLDIGLLQEGDSADFLLVEDLQEFKILENYIGGKPTLKELKKTPIAIEIKNNFHISEKKEDDFLIPAQNGNLRVMEVSDGSILTDVAIMKPKIKQGFAVSDPERDLLKIAVVNRYHETKPALGFIRGFGLKQGALATSVAHDSHNIIAIGADDKSLTRAVNLIIRNKGGICAVGPNSATVLPLPIAGIISDQSCPEVAKKYEQLQNKSQELGTILHAPFMTLSFMALLVIPKLKVSDKGLFDGTKFEFVDTWV